MRRNKRRIIVLSILVMLIVCYIIVVYSNIPFIKKWRTIYIETAMSTMTHQWLATSLIPKSVVDSVVADMNRQLEENLIDENTVTGDTLTWIESTSGLTDEQIAEFNFRKNYAEIDINTLPSNIKYHKLVIENCEEVFTTSGDAVDIIDTINGIVVISVAGNSYSGKLAIVKDPSKVKLASSTKGGTGDFVTNITEDANAILGLNASGFYDPNGSGDGGIPVGLVKESNEVTNAKIEYGYWFVAGFDSDNNLRIGSKVDVDELRDAVQSKPAIIVDGEKKVEGSSGWGIQPRSALGQTATKQVLLLVIDGRNPTHSIGATVGDCADILLKYGAIQAINLDGGSSTAMSYNGKTLNIPSTSNGNKDGRYVPNAWVVERTTEG